MAVLSPDQVARLALDAGLSPSKAVIAVAIAKGESGYRTDARGDVGLQNERWGPSVGLWQIRSVKRETGKGSARDVNRLTDPAFNARSMATISSGGSNWGPWTVYTSGAYKANLREASSAVQRATSGPVANVPGSELSAEEREAPGGGLGVLVDPRTWVRLAWTIGGALAILIGLVVIGKDFLPAGGIMGALR